MIRDAAIDDIKDLLRMGRAFFSATQYPQYMDFSEDSCTETFQHLISDDSGILLVYDNKGLKGMVGALIYPFYMSGQITGQELFWWCEEKGAGKGLLAAVEGKAKSMGAETFGMISLHGLGHERMDSIYTGAGYTRSEHTYLKRL